MGSIDFRARDGMPAVHFDVKTGREIPAHEASRGAPVVGFCSWQRLAEVFRNAGELKEGETLKSFQVDDRGITFRIE